MLFAAGVFFVTYLFKNGGFVSIGPWRGTPDPETGCMHTTWYGASSVLWVCLKRTLPLSKALDGKNPSAIFDLWYFLVQSWEDQCNHLCVQERVACDLLWTLVFCIQRCVSLTNAMQLVKLQGQRQERWLPIQIQTPRYFCDDHGFIFISVL